MPVGVFDAIRQLRDKAVQNNSGQSELSSDTQNKLANARANRKMTGMPGDINSDTNKKYIESVVDNSQDNENYVQEAAVVEESPKSDREIIDGQIADRFTRKQSVSERDGDRIVTFIDNETGETITPDQKDEIEEKMRADFSQSLNGEENQDTTKVAKAINDIKERSSDGRDFSDDFSDYMKRSGLDYNEGSFMFDADRDAWRNFVMDDTISNWYADLYDANGDFDEDSFDKWWKESKGTTYADLMDTSDGTYLLSDWIGGDRDTFDNVMNYIYDEGIGGAKGYYNLAGDMSVDDDRQAILDALAYEYAANAATRALADDYKGDFSKDFTIDNLNRFIKDDDFKIGSMLEDGYQSSSDLGMDTPNPSVLSTNAYTYDEDGRVIPVRGAINNILAALGEGYGAKSKKNG